MGNSSSSSSSSVVLLSDPVQMTTVVRPVSRLLARAAAALSCPDRDRRSPPPPLDPDSVVVVLDPARSRPTNIPVGWAATSGVGWIALGDTDDVDTASTRKPTVWSPDHGDDDDVPVARSVLAQPQPARQIDDRHDRAAQVDDAQDIGRRMRQHGRARPAADFAHVDDVDAEILLADPEGDQFAFVSRTEVLCGLAWSVLLGLRGRCAGVGQCADRLRIDDQGDLAVTQNRGGCDAADMADNFLPVP